MKRPYATLLLLFFMVFSACSGEGSFAGLDVTAYGNLKELMGLYLNRREELALTPQQVEQIKTIRDDFRHQVASQEAELRLAYAELSDLLQEDRTNLVASDVKIRQIAQKGEEIGMKYVRAVSETKKLLTPDQLEKARILMEK